MCKTLMFLITFCLQIEALKQEVKDLKKRENGKFLLFSSHSMDIVFNCMFLSEFLSTSAHVCNQIIQTLAHKVMI